MSSADAARAGAGRGREQGTDLAGHRQTVRPLFLCPVLSGFWLVKTPAVDEWLSSMRVLCRYERTIP